MPKKYLIIIFVILAALVAIDISIRVFLRVPATSSDMVIVNDNTNVPANIAASFFAPTEKLSTRFLRMRQKTKCRWI
jgi:hypothetical protein